MQTNLDVAKHQQKTLGKNCWVEILLMDTLVHVSGNLYLQPPSQNLVFSTDIQTLHSVDTFRIYKLDFSKHKWPCKLYFNISTSYCCSSQWIYISFSAFFFTYTSSYTSKLNTTWMLRLWLNYNIIRKIV